MGDEPIEDIRSAALLVVYGVPPLCGCGRPNCRRNLAVKVAMAWLEEHPVIIAPASFSPQETTSGAATSATDVDREAGTV